MSSRKNKWETLRKQLFKYKTTLETNFSTFIGSRLALRYASEELRQNTEIVALAYTSRY